MTHSNYKPLLYLTTSKMSLAEIQQNANLALSQVENLDQFSQELEDISQDKINVEFASTALATITTAAIATFSSITHTPISMPILATLGGGGSILAWTVLSFAQRQNLSGETDKESLPSEVPLVTETVLEELEAQLNLLHINEIPEDLKFPPGHPIPQKLYREHPLKAKANHYIPVESYYSLLFEEREAELIRILAELGATKICIEEESNAQLTLNLEGEIEVQSIANVEGNIDTQNTKEYKKVRTQEYIGKYWTPDLSFERSKYSWLDYEPTWEAIVEGRLNNGQLSAVIELTTDISNEITTTMGLAEGLLKQLGAFEINLDFSQSHLKRRKFMVEFKGEKDSEQ
ncbi:MAG: hypothetical protein AB4041_00825 [Microcystaceae cyanobacterium]